MMLSATLQGKTPNAQAIVDASVEDADDEGRAILASVTDESDEDLFNASLRHFDRLAASGQPFFSIIMTTSNHKPFTFRPGLETLGIPPEGGGREAGVRYADYALGQFLRAAPNAPATGDTRYISLALIATF